jgi:tRNA(fMet)-specific endonuclease VapC
MFMAEKSDRKLENLNRVVDFLAGLTVYLVDQKTTEFYGELKAKVIDRLGPKEKAIGRRVRVIDLGFSDNDLWIASVAVQHNLTLVSSDSDFERLAAIGNFGVETW